jgi:hypothetical protein
MTTAMTRATIAIVRVSMARPYSVSLAVSPDVEDQSAARVDRVDLGFGTTDVYAVAERLGALPEDLPCVVFFASPDRPETLVVQMAYLLPPAPSTRTASRMHSPRSRRPSKSRPRPLLTGVCGDWRTSWRRGRSAREPTSRSGGSDAPRRQAGRCWRCSPAPPTCIARRAGWASGRRSTLRSSAIYWPIHS